MHRAGFEPALPKEPDLKSGALDHSANDVWEHGFPRNWKASILLPPASKAGALPIELQSQITLGCLGGFW